MASTHSGITLNARSISHSSVHHPRDNRSEPAAVFRSKPIAAKTWDGSIAPEAHDAAAEAITPCRSSSTSSASLSMPCMTSWRIPDARCPLLIVSDHPSIREIKPSLSCSDRRPNRSISLNREAARHSRAAPNATMPAVLCVPLRRSDS